MSVGYKASFDSIFKNLQMFFNQNNDLGCAVLGMLICKVGTNTIRKGFVFEKLHSWSCTTLQST